MKTFIIFTLLLVFFQANADDEESSGEQADAMSDFEN